MLSSLVFTKILGRKKSKEGNYITHSILDFPIIIAGPSEDYYMSMNDKYQT